MHTKPVLELRPVQAGNAEGEGARVYVLLPALEELIGVPGFGLAEPIALPDSLWPLDTLRFFGPPSRPAFETLH